MKINRIEINRKTIPNLTTIQLERISDQDFRELQKKAPLLAKYVLNRANEIARERKKEALTFFNQNPNFPIPVTYQEYEEGNRYKSWRYTDFNDVKVKDKNKELSAFVTAMKFLSTRESNIKNWKAEILDMSERVGFRKELTDSEYKQFWRMASAAYEYTQGTDYRYEGEKVVMGYNTKLQELVRQYMSRHRYKGTAKGSIDSDTYIQNFLKWAVPKIQGDYELMAETEIKETEARREKIARRKNTNSAYKPIR